jgi:integral membrane cytochrome biogenesis protein
MGVGFAGAFLGGLAALLSPCAAMLLPSFFAYAFGDQRRLLVVRTGMFYLGLLLTLVPLGLGAGALGGLLTTQRHLLTIGGTVVLIVLGVITMLGVQLPLPGLRGPARGTDTAAVVVMGAVYGLAGACTGPLLGAVLTLAAIGGSPLYGALLLACFGAGMVAPLLVLAWFWDGLGLSRRLQPRELRLGPLRTSWWALASGLLLTGLGVLFLATDATAAIGGLLDARQQAGLENQLQAWSAGIPDLVMVAIIAAAAGALIWWAGRHCR